MAPVSSLTVRGFKSIRALENFELRRLNVLIGANGAGKSNFIGVFRMLKEMADGRLQLYVQEQDGPDSLLHGSRKRTPEIDVELRFAGSEYRVSLVPSGSRLIFDLEETSLTGDVVPQAELMVRGHDEARMPDVDGTFARYVRPAIASWRVYHFHDTSTSARVRQAQPVRDNLALKADAGNLAPFVRMLRERFPQHYQRIVTTVRMVAPFFGDFLYRESPGERVELEWLESEDQETPRGPRQLSDGTLRFIALATLLLQPTELQPSTILIDEPELGLHPYAIAVLGGLLRQAADERQIIVSTQSADLVDEFAPEDLVVVSRREGASVFERPDPAELKHWLEDYRPGELWKTNVIGGRP